MRIILKDGSGSADLKYLMSDIDRHGNVRLYFRRKGHAKIRLEQPIGTEAFMAEYKAALAKTQPVVRSVAEKKPAKEDTFRWMVAEFCRSCPEYRQLGSTTQDSYKKYLDAISLDHGEKRYALLHSDHIELLRDEKIDTPSAANKRMKVLRLMFKWAKKKKLVSQNPTLGVENLQTFGDGHRAWTMDEILQFMKRHPAHTKAGLAIALLYWLGVRRSDAVNLGRQMETPDGGIRWTEHKGRRRKPKVTERKIEPELRAVLDMHKHNHLTYLLTEYERPFSIAGFGNWFKDRCVEADLKHHSAHGVRKGGATKAADEGASEHTLMSMYGWSTPNSARPYTKNANRKKLAAEGGKLLKFDAQ